LRGRTAPMVRIFVVDDVAERISDLEQEASFSFPEVEIEVLGARNLQEAQRLFKEKNGAFDLVLLDLKLPDDDEGGLRLFEQFASQTPEAVYVLSSGSLADGECPPHSFPKGFSPKNFRCV